MLRVTREELVYECLEELLHEDTSEDLPVTIAKEIAAYNTVPKSNETISLSVAIIIEKHVHRDQRGHLVHREVLLSWGELLYMFGHCFPSFAHRNVQEAATWGVYQHATHGLNIEGSLPSRYHYWGTDTGYPAISRGGLSRRRDMVRVSLGGQHLAEIVGFVKAQLPTSDTSERHKEVVGALVRWLTPHPDAVVHDGSPTCPGQLCKSHNLWSWHRTQAPRRAISGYRLGRLPDEQKAWLQPPSKREDLLYASYDVIEFASIGKYANVAPDFCTNGFLESVSWA